MDAPLDRTKAEQFLGQVVSDVGTALLGALSFIGDRLELFRTLADAGPVTIEALATRTGFSARYLREWLNAMTAAGYVLYRPESGHYVLPPEHATVLAQFGTLGSGNHFLEVCIDERDTVWIVLHSGSRGIGNQLATQHIETAKTLAKQWFLPLEDPDLAYLVQGTPEFTAYIDDMRWSQAYALATLWQAHYRTTWTESLFQSPATREFPNLSA